MQKTHYYLVDTSVILPGAAVSELQFNIIPEEPFVVADLKVGILILNGFIFQASKFLMKLNSIVSLFACSAQLMEAENFLRTFSFFLFMGDNLLFFISLLMNLAVKPYRFMVLDDFPNI